MIDYVLLTKVKKSEKPTVFGNIKKSITNVIHFNKSEKISAPLSITTSKTAIKLEKEKEKQIKHKPEDFELGNLATGIKKEVLYKKFLNK